MSKHLQCQLTPPPWSRVQMLLDWYASVQAGSESARRNGYLDKKRDWTAQHHRFTAAASLLLTDGDCLRAPDLALLQDPKSKLATAPSGAECDTRHTSTDAAAATCRSVRPSLTPFETFNLGGKKTAVSHGMFLKLQDVWVTTKGVLLPAHDTAYTSPTTVVAARTAQEQHDHQVGSGQYLLLFFYPHPPSTPSCFTQMTHAELHAVIGALETAGVDTRARARSGMVGGPFARMVPKRHVVVVMSRASCSSCRIALAHLAKCLKLDITAVQGAKDGGVVHVKNY